MTSTALRLPRQAPGITRGSVGGALSGGVDASGILQALFGDTVGDLIGDAIDTFVPGGSLIHHAADAIYDAV